MLSQECYPLTTMDQKEICQVPLKALLPKRSEGMSLTSNLQTDLPAHTRVRGNTWVNFNRELNWYTDIWHLNRAFICIFQKSLSGFGPLPFRMLSQERYPVSYTHLRAHETPE